MAYFGRKPKKPGSVPGAASGFAQRKAVGRIVRFLRQAVGTERPGRSVRAGRAVRASRNVRSGRSAR